ncbi:phosphoethanolamine transferase CptA [Pseudomonas sp. J452]|uniref:phosphoethanolamine transferase CptA n=1 Tax=Pseudomonas sp. J452 TaxID=2898441 RepID=UPI0021ADC613|nr:phosphoethanolamine transferase CptA [Pseudomonas sp. J452]UUY09065.1 phosphoethanolamine transferase CptA [Pseudomonas sp. J452]
MRKGSRPDWAGLGWMYLFFWYFSGVTHLLILLGDGAGFSGFRQALLMSTIWLAPLLLFPQWARLIAAVLGAVLWLTSLVAFGYFLIYGQEFSQSVIFIMFESNVSEGSEYMAHYFVWWMVPAFLAYGLGAVLLWRRLRPVYFPQRWRVAAPLLLVLLVLGYPLSKEYAEKDSWSEAVEHLQTRMQPAVPWQLVMGYGKYREQLEQMQSWLASNAAVPPLRNLQDLAGSPPATLVLVIGESTNRQRMSLYGYPRQTTPELDALRGQLDVFDNVVTPRPYTIEALQQVLTFADQQNPDAYLSTPSVLNLMKQAGYKTFWITNQQTLTERNTMLTTFSKQADEQVYLNNSRNQNARQYDGDVLAPFGKMLSDPAPRKFIVVHLLGTHMRYRFRYPESFERFNDAQGVPATVTEDQLPTYNSYDNAVLYNDHVVASLIKNLDSQQQRSFLLYLSDHGEAVFDAPAADILGRNEGRPTAPMYTVPFILWRSPQWRESDPRGFADALGRPYSSEHFIHTLADLARLRFDEYEPSKSLVNAQFQERPLLIGDPLKPKSLIDFSLIRPKAAVPAAGLVQADHVPAAKGAAAEL